MDKDLIKNKLYELIDQFNGKQNNHRDFYFTILEEIHPLYDGNGRTCKLLYVVSFN